MATMEDIKQLIVDQQSMINSLVNKVDNLTEKVESLTLENKKNISEKKKISRTINITDDGYFISITGEYQTTAQIKDVLKSHGAKWNRTGKAWRFDSGEKTVDELQELVESACKIMNIESNIVTSKGLNVKDELEE